MYVNPYPADHDFCRFKICLLVDQTDIANKIRVETSGFAKV